MDASILEEVQRVWRHDDNLKENTIQIYTRETEQWEAWLAEQRTNLDGTPKALWDADGTDLDKYLRNERKSKGYSDTAVNKARSGINKFYHACMKIDKQDRLGLFADDFVHPNEEYNGSWTIGKTKSAEGADEGEEYTYITEDEVKELIANVPAPRTRNELIIGILFNTGIRRGELSNIKIEPHLNRKDQTITIPAQKGLVDREVSYNDKYVGKHLKVWLDGGYRDSQTYAHESEYLFPTNDSVRINPDWVNTIVKQAAENAGIQATVAEYADQSDSPRKMSKVTAKTLRHSHAHHSIEAGIDVRFLAYHLGHVNRKGELNLDTTMKYQRGAGKDAVEAFKRDF